MSYIYKFLLLVFLITTLRIEAQTANRMSIRGTITANSVSVGVWSVVDSLLVVTSNGTISGFTVTIIDGYILGDSLSYNGQLPMGIQALGFNSSTRSIVFSGVAASSVWQNLLRRVIFKSSNSTCASNKRKIQFISGEKYASPFNNHFYEIYPISGSWTNAKAHAESKSYFGQRGYLATITSLAENTFISDLIGSTQPWIGCSDNFSQINLAFGYNLYADQAASEGNFYWVQGPERGLKINSFNAYNSGGIGPVSGVYNNWGPWEPNDWPSSSINTPGEEDYVQIVSANRIWNDLADFHTVEAVIEYGGMPDDTVSSVTSYTRDITINGLPNLVISGGNVTVCSGTNSVTLRLSGPFTSILRWESSLDNFISSTSVINQRTSTLALSNIQETTYYRAIVNTSSGCLNMATYSSKITVLKNLPGVAVPLNDTICNGSLAQLKLYGNSGNVIGWSMSTSPTFSNSIIAINSTKSNIARMLTNAGTYYFRAEIGHPGCGSSVFTEPTPIVVKAGTTPIAGILNNIDHCGGSSNSGTLTLSGYSGNIISWESSIDEGVTWSKLTNTGNSYSYSGQSNSKWYRVLVGNGVCEDIYSSIGKVTVMGINYARWDGGVSTAWQNSANWCGGIGDNGIDVVINSTASNNLILDQDRYIGNLYFNNSGKYLTLGNNILTASNVIGPNSTSYIVTNGSGKLSMQIPSGETKIFPIGNAAFNPVFITNKNTNTDIFSVRVFDEVYEMGYTGYTSVEPRVKRTWDIDKGQINIGGVGFQFNWNNGETHLLTTPTLYHFENGNWFRQIGVTTSTSNSLTYPDYIGSFSPFAIGNDLTPLDVKLLSFGGFINSIDRVAELNWIATNESSNFDFIVQKFKSSNGWVDIAKVPSKNSGKELTYYSIKDVSLSTFNFYRLKYSPGSSSDTLYSDVVELTNSEIDNIYILPNPSKGWVQLYSEMPSYYELYNSIGLKIREGELVQKTIIENLSSGIYILKYSNKIGNGIRKIVVE